MLWRQGCFLVLCSVLLAQTLAIPCSVEVCDLQCEAQEYALTVNSSYENDCCSVCGVPEMDYSGSAGYAYDCAPCDALCISCYGPTNSQCYSCRGYFLIVQQKKDSVGVECENGTVRNVSMDVLMCLSECPQNSNNITSNKTMECTCAEGYYLDLNSISCMKCANHCSQCVNGTQSGCLQCAEVRYQNDCVAECPSGTTNIDGNCQTATSNSLFGLDRIQIFSIIGGAAFLILFCACWISCVAYCCMYNEIRKQAIPYDDEDGTIISESFKKVKRTISIKRRPPKIRTLSQAHEAALHANRVSQAFDPYLQPTADSDLTAHQQQIQQPEYLQLVDRKEQSVGEGEEDVYMQMTPASSVENLENESSAEERKHKKVKLSYTQSLEPQTTAPPVKVRISTGSLTAFTRVGGNIDDDQEVYVNPGELEEEEEDHQEDYEVMEHNERQEPEDYVVFVNSSRNEEVEEQELYTEMDHYPPVPSKSVITPSAKTPEKQGADGTRKKTLDNQYVKIVGNDPRAALKRNMNLSNEQLNKDPKYVNVQRHNDPRLRSVTSPPMTSSKPLKAPKPKIRADEQPIYQNYTVEETEKFYDN